MSLLTSPPTWNRHIVPISVGTAPNLGLAGACDVASKFQVYKLATHATRNNYSHSTTPTCYSYTAVSEIENIPDFLLPTKLMLALPDLWTDTFEITQICKDLECIAFIFFPVKRIIPWNNGLLFANVHAYNGDYRSNNYTQVPCIDYSNLGFYFDDQLFETTSSLCDYAITQGYRYSTYKYECVTPPNNETTEKLMKVIRALIYRTEDYRELLKENMYLFTHLPQFKEFIAAISKL
jgi:hypothetical protein